MSPIEKCLSHRRYIRGPAPRPKRHLLPSAQRAALPSMSPRYTTLKPYPEATVAYNNMRKVLENEDPRFRNIDRMLARAFIELQKQRRQQQSGIFTPRYVHTSSPAACLDADQSVPFQDGPL